MEFLHTMLKSRLQHARGPLDTCHTQFPNKGPETCLESCLHSLLPSFAVPKSKRFKEAGQRRLYRVLCLFHTEETSTWVLGPILPPIELLA